MNVLDLAMTFGLQPFKKSSSKGGQYSSSCPFCGGSTHPNGERSDRFQIWPDQSNGNGSYWCSRCGAHGDRIQFVMDTQHLGFKEACRVMGDDAIAAEFKSNSDAPYMSRVPASPQQKTAYVPRNTPAGAASDASDVWREKSFKLVVWAAAQLPGSSGEKVLEKKGISMETARARGLGWIPEDVYRPRESWALPTVIKEDTGKPKRLWIPKGLVIPHFSINNPIPIHFSNNSGSNQDDIPTDPLNPAPLHFSNNSGSNQDNSPTYSAKMELAAATNMGCVLKNDLHFGANMGCVLRLRIRRQEGEPRYYVVPGSDAGQMILGNPGRCVVVVESELDAILLDQVAGDITAVIAMGTSHAKPDAHAAHILQDALCILVAMDFDDAGKSSFAWWKQIYPRAIRWPVPAGKDPSDAHHEGVDLRAWIIAGWPAGWRLTKPGAQASTKLIHTTDNNPAPDTQQTIPGQLDQDLSISLPKSKNDTLQDASTDPIYELQSLMSKNPRIRIVISNHRMTLDAPAEWQARNAGIFGRISQLVYFDPAVFEYLHSLGVEIINCDNLTNY